MQTVIAIHKMFHMTYLNVGVEDQKHCHGDKKRAWILKIEFYNTKCVYPFFYILLKCGMKCSLPSDSFIADHFSSGRTIIGLHQIYLLGAENSRKKVIQPIFSPSTCSLRRFIGNNSSYWEGTRRYGKRLCKHSGNWFLLKIKERHCRPPCDLYILIFMYYTSERWSSPGIV